MTDNVKLYPLDASLLTKGQTITIAELCKIFGVSYPHEYWGFKLMELVKRIRKQRRDRGLGRLTMRSRDGEVHVCTDEEAAEHNNRKACAKARGYVYAAADNLAVDESKLSQADRETHQRVVMRQAMMLRAIRTAQHSKLPELTGPVERVTPKMLVFKDAS